MKKRKNASKRRRMPARQIRDVSNRDILKDPVLCLQFLKDYVDENLFRDIKPEDIEDESEKYQAYLGVEFETDTVKKIRMNREAGEVPLYLISLVEHKSQVDYNVSMQILRYMVCIWNEYGREMMSLEKGNVKNKSFRYPPILPIVYYEGSEGWTADMHLKDRIMMNEFFGSYIPDFTYKLVRNHDYSNEELLRNEDEMSLLMMLGKAQTPEDIQRLLNTEREQVQTIINKAPEHILELIASTVWSLCMKMNVSQDEAKQCVRKVRERQMGYWFENMEKMDIQAERRNTAQARKEAEEAKREAKEAQRKAEEVQRKAETTIIQKLVETCRELGASKDVAISKLMEKCGLEKSEANEKVDLYWEKKENGKK